MFNLLKTKLMPFSMQFLVPFLNETYKLDKLNLCRLSCLAKVQLKLRYIFKNFALKKNDWIYQFGL